MLYYLEGTVAELSTDAVILDCGGVGFELAVTPHTVSSLSIGGKSKIYVIESIGEDHYELFGFLSTAEKNWFRLLTSVSGVGPKAGMSILSYNTADILAAAVINGDEKVFTACPGIGKKIAQRIILELKDKIAKSMPSVGATPVNIGSKRVQSSTSISSYDDAVTALNVLGYSTADIVPVLRQIDLEGKNTQEIIREFLKFMV